MYIYGLWHSCYKYWLGEQIIALIDLFDHPVNKEVKLVVKLDSYVQTVKVKGKDKHPQFVEKILNNKVHDFDASVFKNLFKDEE